MNKRESKQQKVSPNKWKTLDVRVLDLDEQVHLLADIFLKFKALDINFESNSIGMIEKTPPTTDSIKVVVIYRGREYRPEFLEENPDLLSRFPSKATIDKNYDELKKRGLPGTVEIWQHMILAKDENRNLLWQDDLTQ
jgi:hypothetical protein